MGILSRKMEFGVACGESGMLPPAVVNANYFYLLCISKYFCILNMFRFNRWYFVLVLLLFAIEFIIGADFHDTIIRPYGGDFLVVILIYCFVKSFINAPVVGTALGVLLFSYLMEVSQYFHLVNLLGLQHSKLAKIMLGTSFSFTDLLAYTLGIGLVIVIENLRLSMKNF
jgi:hypothetical protein